MVIIRNSLITVITRPTGEDTYDEMRNKRKPGIFLCNSPGHRSWSSFSEGRKPERRIGFFSLWHWYC